MWFVYILENTESKKFYIGCTQDIAKRAKEHNYKKKRTWSGRQRGEWLVAYKKEYIDKSEALKREKAIKRMKSRSYIKRLIESSNHISGSSISLV